ncbi:MAG: dihydroorotate dehydrogenase electron transfer subunit [archaeon]|nr:dihydroorotate dehydrogenase electron transfer subunit [archaeon]
MNRVVVVKENETLNSNTHRITFTWDADCKPGQFVMVWIPGMEEIPISLSDVKTIKSITFKIIGKDTEILGNLKNGDKMHIRGPYGNGYSIDFGYKKKILLVGGGIGTAPLIPVMKCRSVDVAIAARNLGEIECYVPSVKNFAMKYWIATDDGSMGFHGNVIDLVKGIMREEQYDEVIACGPEIMLFLLHKFLNRKHIGHQMSLERYMKCGCGMCGSCMIDDKRVCRDGPVFNNDEIDKLKEFGVSKRGIDGSVILF